jgi:predicted GIY-YIG superfamily endonuclease
MESADAAWKCYLLVTTDGKQKTYVGVTPDLDRRLRQHNGVICGGAAATAGRSWERVCHVRGFPDQRAALQFEWRWKQLSRKRFGTGEPLQRRLQALQELLALDRPTMAAMPYTDYATPLEVILETGRELPAL